LQRLDEPYVKLNNHPVIDEVVSARSLEYRGEGELKLHAGQEGPPEGPGQVRFALRYAPVEDGPPHSDAIKISLLGLDDGANEVLLWSPEEESRPLPHYDLSGTIEAEGEQIPIRVEQIVGGIGFPSDMRGHFAALTVSQETKASKVTAGSGLDADPARVRALVPNLAFPGMYEFEVEGLRVRLSEAYSGAYIKLRKPDPQDVCKVLPGSHLDLERLGGPEENNVLLAI
jgi:hypothetical protein